MMMNKYGIKMPSRPGVSGHCERTRGSCRELGDDDDDNDDENDLSSRR